MFQAAKDSLCFELKCHLSIRISRKNKCIICPVIYSTFSVCSLESHCFKVSKSSTIIGEFVLVVSGLVRHKDL